MVMILDDIYLGVTTYMYMLALLSGYLSNQGDGVAAVIIIGVN